MFFNCFNCHKIAPLIETPERKCSLCGSANGEVLNAERVKEGLEAGVFYNIDPKTGRRAKKRR